MNWVRTATPYQDMQVLLTFLCHQNCLHPNSKKGRFLQRRIACLCRWTVWLSDDGHCLCTVLWPSERERKLVLEKDVLSFVRWGYIDHNITNKRKMLIPILAQISIFGYVETGRSCAKRRGAFAKKVWTGTKIFSANISYFVATNHYHRQWHQIPNSQTSHSSSSGLNKPERNQKKENHLNTISKMMGTLVHVQLHTFSYRKAVIRPQNMPKTADWG